MKVKDLIEKLEKLDPELVVTDNNNELIDVHIAPAYWDGSVISYDRKTSTVTIGRSGDKVVLTFLDSLGYIYHDTADGHEITVRYKDMDSYLSKCQEVMEMAQGGHEYRLKHSKEFQDMPKLSLDQFINMVCVTPGIWWISETWDCMNFLRKKDSGAIERWKHLDQDPDYRGANALASGNIPKEIIYGDFPIREIMKDYFDKVPCVLDIVWEDRDAKSTKVQIIKEKGPYEW